MKWCRETRACPCASPPGSLGGASVPYSTCVTLLGACVRLMDALDCALKDLTRRTLWVMAWLMPARGVLILREGGDLACHPTLMTLSRCSSRGLWFASSFSLELLSGPQTAGAQRMGDTQRVCWSLQQAFQWYYLEIHLLNVQQFGPLVASPSPKLPPSGSGPSASSASLPLPAYLRMTPTQPG